jgi:RNA polymerase sigma-70 factor (ECF subfamily)
MRGATVYPAMHAPADLLAPRQQRFEQLVRPHLGALLAFAARRTLSHGDAEDALQDACARAWAAFDDLRDPDKVRAWMYTILRTVLSELADRSGRRARLVPMSRLEDVHESLVAGDSEAVFLDVVGRIERDMLRDALDAIPDDFSTCVELHDLDGFRYAEIAELVGIPIGTVMSRISRGRRLLAGVIAERLASRGSRAVDVERKQAGSSPRRTP